MNQEANGKQQAGGVALQEAVVKPEEGAEGGKASSPRTLTVMGDHQLLVKTEALLSLPEVYSNTVMPTEPVMQAM